MEQEHRITYKAGITRSPSDFLCQDGELAECINLATDNEELKPMVQPAEYMRSASGVNITRRVLYVHKYNNEERYISFVVFTSRPPQYYLSWGIRDTSGTYPVFSEQDDLITYDNINDLDNIKITSIGKTLIVADEEGMHYFLWQESSYQSLGDLPSPKIEFFLVGTTGLVPGNKYNTAHGLACDDVIMDNGRMESGKQEEYNDLVIGLYSKNKKSIAQKKEFCEPFFVRAAIELYDGTYTHITQPVLLFPAITDNSLLVVNNGIATIETRSCALYYKNSTNLQDWSDIVKDIVVFITDGVNIYDLSVDQPNSMTLQTEIQNAIFSTDNLNISNKYRKVSGTGFRDLKKRDQSEILDDIKASSIFYKLCEIEKTGDGVAHDIGQHFDTHKLENITTQERLEYDDYYSRNKIIPKFLYSYNSRLNIANVTRGFFEGFDYFMPYDNDVAHTYTFYVTIKTDIGNVTVRHRPDYNPVQKQGIYFYYPDSRATHVMIFKKSASDQSDSDGDCILNADLTEHSGLNGAYYLKGLPQETESESTVTGTSPSYDNSATEQLGNYIIQSEVNNPWVFKAEGYNKVGTGKIMGMSTITQALSQGQFGQYPLLVFSDSGIWAMSVDGSGLYQNIQPMSREVCLNENTITQTDGAVFFVSKKGLMVIVGNDVRCVSEKMNGVTFNTSVLTPLATGTDWANIVTACQTSRSFLDFMRDKDTFMAYDYVDSRLLICNPNIGFSFVYNIADGTISKTVLPSTMWNAVNNYPDYLLQGDDDNVYSFYEKPREEEINSRQLAFLLTRPMKLAGPVSQASLRQLMNVGTWDVGTTQTPLSCVKTEVYISSDQKNWYNDISRHGAAARYYRLALYLKLLPTERLSGTILTGQERRSNNMR